MEEMRKAAEEFLVQERIAVAGVSVAAVPERPYGVVIATRPDAAVDVVRDWIEAGVARFWMHRSFGTGSVSAEAAVLCRRGRGGGARWRLPHDVSWSPWMWPSVHPLGAERHRYA